MYSDEESLPFFDEELRKIEPDLKSLGIELQVIFVDDGSADDSIGELVKIQATRPSCTVVKLTRNFGSVSAAKAGFRYVSGDCFMVFAADLQEPTELIVELVKRWLDGSKLAILVRRTRGDPIASRVFSWIYYRLVRLFVFKDFPRGGFDVALMDRALLPHMQNSGTPLCQPH